jgi:hypothetical protein
LLSAATKQGGTSSWSFRFRNAVEANVAGATRCRIVSVFVSYLLSSANRSAPGYRFRRLMIAYALTINCFRVIRFLISLPCNSTGFNRAYGDLMFSLQAPGNVYWWTCTSIAQCVFVWTGLTWALALPKLLRHQGHFIMATRYSAPAGGSKSIPGSRIALPDRCWWLIRATGMSGEKGNNGRGRLVERADGAIARCSARRVAMFRLVRGQLLNIRLLSLTNADMLMSYRH